MNYSGHTPINTVANPPSKFEAYVEGCEFLEVSSPIWIKRERIGLNI